MRRILTLLTVSLALMLGSVNELNAQGAHAKGDIFLNPGIGFGTWGIRGGGRTPVAIQFDAHFGVHDYVSVSPYFTMKFSPVVIGVGARGLFHFYQLIGNKVSKDIKSDQIDIYVHLAIGTDIATDGFNPGANFRMAGGVGLRWMPHPTWGMFTEFGNPASIWSLGACIRL